MEQWKKLGQIFSPAQNFEWMYAYATYPVADYIDGSLFNIYFSCRDINNKSAIGRIVYDMDKFEIISLDKNPVIEKGGVGLFDDSGVSMSCIITVQEKKYLYYLGWNLGVTFPWRNTIGLAIKDKTEIIFKKYSKAPILGIHEVDPYTLTYPYVLYDEGIYKMWYGSSLFWGPTVNDTQHVIKYATSIDGINWERNEHICINTKNKEEFAIVKPFVVKENSIYKMWYACRDKTYHIGYATSANGLDWTRKDDQAGINVSATGWDSEMICYPHIFDYKGNRYMLYNGNGYGKTGFGIAILEK